jgi:hypothetical protein
MGKAETSAVIDAGVASKPGAFDRAGSSIMIELDSGRIFHRASTVLPSDIDERPNTGIQPQALVAAQPRWRRGWQLSARCMVRFQRPFFPYQLLALPDIVIAARLRPELEVARRDLSRQILLEGRGARFGIGLDSPALRQTDQDVFRSIFQFIAADRQPTDRRLIASSAKQLPASADDGRR